MATVTQTSTAPGPSTLSTPQGPSTPPEPAPAPTPSLTLYRMSYDLYERIVELELLRTNDHVVLLDGLLVNLMPKGARHRNAVVRGLSAFSAALPPGWVVWSEQAIVLRGGPDGDSAPEPDLVVVFGDLGRYEERLPEASETGMVVEVATSADAMRIDRAGLARYAFAGIAIACIVNVPDRSVEVHSEPSGPSADPGYRRVETFRPGQSLAFEVGNASTGPAAIAPIAVDAFFAPN